MPVTDRSRPNAALGLEGPACDCPAQFREGTPDVLFQALPATYTTDAEGRITYYNEAAAQLWGVRPELGESSYCGSFKLYRPDGAPLRHDECPMAVALKTGRAVRGVEAIAERPDGTRVSFIPYPTPLFDADGVLTGAVNMLVDITPLKTAEGRVSESEAQFRSIFQSARVALWVEDFSGVIDMLDEIRTQGVVDLRGYLAERPERIVEAIGRVRVLDVNDFTLELYEAEDKQAMLASLQASFLPETIPVFAEELYTLWDGGRRFENEARVRTLKGRMLDIAFTMAFEGERCERTLVSILDISARKAAERRLETLNRIGQSIASERDLKRIVQTVTDSATELSGAKFGAFFYNVAGEEGEALTLFTLSGAPREAFEKLGLPRNTPLFEPTFRGAGIVRSHDIRQDPRYGKNTPHWGMPEGHLPVVSYLAAPVVSASGQVHGGLFFGHDQPGVFTEEAERIVAGIAGHAAVAIDNARLLHAAEREIAHRRRAESEAAKRLEEQSALYVFVDRLYRADSLTQVFEASIDAIVGALRCERASILLFDEGGRMRFVSWRGLSDFYRAAVEGHSPWTPDTEDPAPIAIGDVAASDLSTSLKQTVEAEGIGALAFIPIVANGKLAGKFMAYYDAPHAFSEAEVDLSVTIARQIGFSMERQRAEKALQVSEARERARAAELESIMEAAPVLIWIARDPDCTTIRGNRMSQEVLRMPTHANPSLSAPEDARPTHFTVLSEGRVLKPAELPVQRAARGEEVRNFEEEVRFEDGASRHLLGNATPLRDAAGRPCGAVAAFVDITERRWSEEQRTLLINELNHRVKNTLATVQSLAVQSMRDAESGPDAFAAFESRLAALARAHDLLTLQSWQWADLREVVDRTLAPFRTQDRFIVEGPAVRLSPRQALALAMALHELATNAVKYGALSNEAGRVGLRWTIERGEGGRDELALTWCESDGPPVAPPRRTGFGSRLISRSLAHELGAAASIDFRPEGVISVLRSPLESLGAA